MLIKTTSVLYKNNKVIYIAWFNIKPLRVTFPLKDIRLRVWKVISNPFDQDRYYTIFIINLKATSSRPQKRKQFIL
jgi:hypothetical protein